MRYRLGIIGPGNMAEAIVRGILHGGTLSPADVIAAGPSASRRAVFAEMGVNTTDDNRRAAESGDVVLIGVKPQKARLVLEQIAPVVTDRQLVVSIMAGVSSAQIDQWLGGGRRVVRTMPNTPILVGAGMVAVARGDLATADDVAAATALFESSAGVIEVREDQIDAVTAVSGSGPAYFFYVVEQMTAAGVAMGLSPEQAHLLATRTCLGAGRMMTESAEPPAALRGKVTSPGGTTHAAISYLVAAGLPKIIADAMAAAAARSRELGG